MVTHTEKYREKLASLLQFFWNGHGSWLHTLTTPNRLVRLSAQGEVLYSSRLTVKAKCEMDLHRFPLDIQVQLFFQLFIRIWRLDILINDLLADTVQRECAIQILRIGIPFLS